MAHLMPLSRLSPTLVSSYLDGFAFGWGVPRFVVKPSERVQFVLRWIQVILKRTTTPVDLFRNWTGTLLLFVLCVVTGGSTSWAQEPKSGRLEFDIAVRVPPVADIAEFILIDSSSKRVADLVCDVKFTRWSQPFAIVKIGSREQPQRKDRRYAIPMEADRCRQLGSSLAAGQTLVRIYPNPRGEVHQVKGMRMPAANLTEEAQPIARQPSDG